jgi:hypothetical protein
VNILNKQPWTNDKGDCPSAWGLGVGLTTLHHKKEIGYEQFTQASDLDEFFGNILALQQNVRPSRAKRKKNDT